MALEAVILPYDSFSYCSKECYAMVGGRWVVDGIGKREEENKGLVAAEGDRAGDGSGTSSGGAELGKERGRGASDSAPHGDWGLFCSSVVKSLEEECDVDPPSLETFAREGTFVAAEVHAPASTGAAESGVKRRRTKCCKNRKEVENQRMTHNAVERNRRKQMNEYLSVLRSLMPPSYVQRGDQASIVGGAINFVKELEQLLQSLEAQKRVKEKRQPDAAADATAGRSSSSSSPFSRFFTFPQYSSSTSSSAPFSNPLTAGAAASDQAAEMNHRRPALADIEVTMVERHANLRVLSRRCPKQLLRLVAGLLGLRLSVLHLNITTAVDRMVLYSFSVKVEDDCQLSSRDDIAASVHQMLGKIQEDGRYHVHL